MKRTIWIRYILMTFCVIVLLLGWVIRENVDILLIGLYVMLGLGIGSMLIMSLFSLAQNPKSAIQAVVGLVAVLVLIGVAWMLSSDTPLITPTGEYTNPFELKITDTILYVMYVLLGVAVLSIVVGEIRNAFK